MKFMSYLGLTLTLIFSLGTGATELSADELKEVSQAVKGWPDESKQAADFMVKKYGKPDGITPTMLVWNDIKPFKKSIVYKEAVVHKFPVEHKDVLEHFIDYPAPEADKVAEVWKFDGSVILERTKGEMSARCDKEAANILALNLADQVIKGEKTVEEARLEYGKQILSMKEGTPQKLTQKLVFTPAGQEAGDADVSIMEKVKTIQAQEEKTEAKPEDKE